MSGVHKFGFIVKYLKINKPAILYTDGVILTQHWPCATLDLTSAYYIYKGLVTTGNLGYQTTATCNCATNVQMSGGDTHNAESKCLHFDKHCSLN